MNPLLGPRAQKSRGLFTRQGAGLGPCPQLWRAHSCPYRVFSPEPRYARPAGANATLSSERGETSWQPPTGWHRGLACRLPGLQSPGCSWWGGGAGRAPPRTSIHDLPGAERTGKRRSGLCITWDLLRCPPSPTLQGQVPATCPPGDCRPTHVPPQQGLPEGWEDTVIVVPGGRQVGPARVSGVQTPRSLSHEGRWGQGISEGSLPSEEPVLGSAEGDPEPEASSSSIAQKQRPREKGLPQGSKRVSVRAKGLR